MQEIADPRSPLGHGGPFEKAALSAPPWLDLDLGRSLQPAYLTLIFADLSSCSALIQIHHDNVKPKVNWFVNHKW